MRRIMIALVLFTAGEVHAQGVAEYGLATGAAGGSGISATSKLSGATPLGSGGFSSIGSIGGGGGGGGGFGGFGGFGGGGGGGVQGGVGAGALKLTDPETIAHVHAQIKKRSIGRVYVIPSTFYYHRHDHLTFEEVEGISVTEAHLRALAPCPECAPPKTQEALDREKKAGRRLAPQYKAYLNNRSPVDAAGLVAKR